MLSVSAPRTVETVDLRSSVRAWSPRLRVWVAFLALPAGFGAVLMVLHVLRVADGPTIMMDLNANPWRPAYHGVGSVIGYLLWAAMIAVCGFSAMTLHALARPAAVPLLASVGLLSLCLLADDVLMLHERLRAAAEVTLYVIYGTITLAVLINGRSLIARNEPLLLAGAMGCFAGAILLDVTIPFERRWGVILEDTMKLCGQALWLGYFCRLAFREIKAAGRDGRRRAEARF